MEIRFKCKCCKSYHEIERTVPDGYAGWCYADMEWLAPAEALPPLTQDKGWARCETPPKAGEIRKLRVKNPFHEAIGSSFFVDYESALQFFNGYDKAEEFESYAIVQCRLERVIEQNDTAAWVEVCILDVIPYCELASRFPAFHTAEPLENYAGGACEETDLDAPPWKIVYWTAQGDVGEQKTIFTDENGVRHLVLHYDYCSWAAVQHFGNIIEK